MVPALVRPLPRGGRGLDTVVHGTKRVLVGFTRFGDFCVGIVLCEVGGIPVLHGDHRMIRSGQGFFSANGVNPLIDCLLVGQAQLIKILFAHNERRLTPGHGRVNCKGTNLTEN
jgi:hypothetical protein